METLISFFIPLCLAALTAPAARPTVFRVWHIVWVQSGDIYTGRVQLGYVDSQPGREQGRQQIDAVLVDVLSSWQYWTY